MSPLAWGVIGSAAFVILATARLLWIEERRERLRKELQGHAFRHRPRGTITRIGQVKKGPDGKWHAWNFEVDCHGCIPAACAMHDGEKVHDLIGGWTEEELIEMANRRREWS